MVAKVVGFHAERSLGVVQFGTSGQNSIQYISSSKAIKEKLIEVREVSEAGSVNLLSVVNFSDFLVFLMDGDILSGAKQNRIVNTSMLLAPHSKTRIPVSCVERGRWNRRSDTFDSTLCAAPGSFRGEKAREVRANLKLHKGFAAEQNALWDRVRRVNAEAGASSSTEDLADGLSTQQAGIDSLLRACSAEPHANGIALFVGRRLSSLDLFNRTEVCAEYLPKLVRGAAREMLPSATDPIGHAEAEYRTLTLLDTLEGLPGEEYQAAGVGTDRRFESIGLAGFRLDYGVHLIHMAAFSSAGLEAA